MKIPTKPPEIGDIMRENVQYSAHLVMGGKPIRLVLELVPTQVGFDWHLHSEIPQQAKELPYTMMFTDYSVERITAVLQPPPDEPDTNTKTS